MRNVHLILVWAASLLPLATAQAAPADVPETGQTTCFGPDTLPIDCGSPTAAGQDGALQAGVAWPSPRFVVDSTGDCVTDKLTGLMWVRAPSASVVGWTTALTDANNLTLCGFSDWRLPNISELESLVNGEAANQATFLNAQGFTNVQVDKYWSSSSLARNASLAWAVSMSDGFASHEIKDFPAHTAWPVRAGP
jgi:hypothetical protein